MKKVFLFLILLLFVACGTEKTERITFTKATLYCDDVLYITVSVSFLKEAVIEDIKWQCEETVNDSTFKRHYIAYHIYTGRFGWYVQEDPRKFLATKRRQ